MWRGFLGIPSPLIIFCLFDLAFEFLLFFGLKVVILNMILTRDLSYIHFHYILLCGNGMAFQIHHMFKVKTF